MPAVLEWISKGIGPWRMSSVFLSSVAMLALYNFAPAVPLLREDFFSAESGALIAIVAYLSLFSIADLLLQLIRWVADCVRDRRRVRISIRELEPGQYACLVDNCQKGHRTFDYAFDDRIVLSLEHLGMVEFVKLSQMSTAVSLDEWICVIERRVWAELKAMDARRKARERRAARGSDIIGWLLRFTKREFTLKRGKAALASDQQRFDSISTELRSSAPVRRMRRIKEILDSGGPPKGWRHDPTSEGYGLMKEAERENEASPLLEGTTVLVQRFHADAYNGKAGCVLHRLDNPNHYSVGLSDEPSGREFHVMYLTRMDLLEENEG